MQVAASILLSATLLATGSAFAQQPQRSDEIVKFFEESANLGATRGICVGTEAQCAGKTEPAKLSGLDMLVNFDLNSANLTPDARAKLDEFVKALNDERLKSFSFVVEGHTDASGPETFNDTLSELRARSVTEFLLASGVEASRIEAIGMGENSPRTDDAYDPVNRRVEMRLNATQ